MIPFYGVDRQYLSLRDEILDASDKVYRSGKMLDGDYTTQFEMAMAKYCHRQYAITVNSGTTGLLLALQSLDRRDNILIPSISFIATLNSALLAFSDDKIHMTDVDFAGLMDLDSVSEQLHLNIDTIMYVNLFGNTIDYDRFRVVTEFFHKNDIKVVEDAAQSFGASYKGIPSGKMGDISVLSFDPTKNFNNYGSGGMILTDDAHIAESVRDFKNNGKSTMTRPGVNSKMSEIDCAQMLIKLKYFEQWQRRRAEIAEHYEQSFGHFVDLLPTTEGTVHARSKFAFRVGGRNNLQGFLLSENIPTLYHYAIPLYDYASTLAGPQMPFLDTAAWGSANFARQTISLPIYPELTDSEVEHIADTVKRYFSMVRSVQTAILN